MKTWNVVALVVFVAIQGFVIWPRLQASSEMGNEKVRLESELQSAVDRVQELKDERSKPTPDTQNALKSIPLHHEQEEVIEDLEQIARETGFGFDSLSFSQRENTDVGAGELGISFSTSGPRSNLVRFLKRIEHNQRFLALNDLSVNTNFINDLPMVEFGVSLSAFFQE